MRLVDSARLATMFLCSCWLLLAAPAAYLSESWAMLTASRPTKPTCVDIPRNLTLCHNIDYRQMRLPNLLEHETMDEVTQQASSWVPLLRLNCHTDTQLFLCSLFAPVCLDRTIQPCRSLCEVVKSGCESRMRMYGFPWPAMLNCNQFPPAHDMCIKPRASYTQAVNESACAACNQVGTYENILDHFCRSRYAMKVKLRRVEGNHLVVKRGRFLQPRDGNNRILRNSRVYFNSQNESCPCPIRRADQKKRFLILADQSSTGQFVLNLLLPWKKEKSFKRSIRMFRKLDCRTLGTQMRDRARREGARRYRKGKKRKGHSRRLRF